MTAEAETMLSKFLKKISYQPLGKKNNNKKNYITFLLTAEDVKRIPQNQPMLKSIDRLIWYSRG